MNNICFEIERLLNFGLQKKLLTKDDIIPVRNHLLDFFNESMPYTFSDNEQILESLETATPILKNILDHAYTIGLIENNTTTNRDLLDAKIMNFLMPRASEVITEFNNLYKINKKAATDYLYALSRNSNYIQVDRIEKNEYWQTKTKYGNLEITINLSKPEKSIKEIEAAKQLPQTGYPKCLLCKENAGFAGNTNHPARQNLRLIPISLNGENWYLQYSPYVYYNEHSIVLANDHYPMKISETTLKRLADFVTLFPHYFIGSNADLPIVGGSILSHDHYQAGRHIFPIEKAKALLTLSHNSFTKCNFSIIKWPMSVIRIQSKNKNELIKSAIHIMNKWSCYSDVLAHIIAFSNDTPHNTITPIMRFNKNGEYELDIVLRNNRTTAEFPMGIFHPHPNLHHIKKENIGLIEVMGLAILPGRLSEELSLIADILSSNKPFDINSLDNSNKDILNKHESWIIALSKQYGTNNSLALAKDIVKKESGNIFLEVLKDAGVFKQDTDGVLAFKEFMRHCGFSE